jgi:hypothetical protein
MAGKHLADSGQPAGEHTSGFHHFQIIVLGRQNSLRQEQSEGSDQGMAASDIPQAHISSDMLPSFLNADGSPSRRGPTRRSGANHYERGIR